jgi:plastocyanin domain-containing protein
MKRTAFLAIVPALLLSLLCPFAGAQDKKAPPPVIAAVGQDGVQRADIIGGSYFFRPNHIVVKANTPVELRFMKESGMTPHNLVMSSPDAGMDFTVDLGTEPQVIRFTPTRPGKYPFYCSKKLLFFASHRENGMEGVIEVVP